MEGGEALRVFDGDGLAVGAHQLAVADFEAGFLQQPRRLAQIVAGRFRIAADRILVGHREDLGRHLVAHRFENLQLLPLGKSRRGEFGNAVKIAAVAMVLSVRELPVRLFPVIGIIEGTTDPDIRKQRPTQVECETLHPPRTRIREFFLDGAFFAHGRKIVSRRPFLAAALVKPVQLISLESLAPDRIVAKEFKPKLVEIILADAVRQILAPVILDPFQHQCAARDKLLDTIGRGPQRNLQCCRRDVPFAPLRVDAFPPVLRQHRNFACDRGKFAVAGPVEGKFDIALASLLALDDVPVVGAVHRTVLLERVEREDDVVRGHRLAIVPARRGIQAIDDVGKIVGIGDGFRQQPIGRRRFILRPGRQRLNDHGGAAGDRPLQALDHDVEVVEGSEFEQARDALLRRIRIDVIEALEAGRIFDIAKRRHGVPPGQSVRRGLRVGRLDRGNAGGEAQCRRHRGCGTALQEISSGDRQIKNSCC